MVNGLGSYEVKVSCEARVSYGVIGEGSFEGFGERCCECQTQVVVKLDVSHSEGVVVVY